LEVIRRNIESLGRLERLTLQDNPKDMSLAVRREKENFAAYIANPQKAFDTNLPRGEVFYKVLLSFGYLILIIWIRPSIPWPVTHEAGYIFDQRREVKEIIIYVLVG
jgi:hypothetical protein